MAAGDGVRAASEPAFSWRRCKRRFAPQCVDFAAPAPNLPRRRAGFFRVSRFQREALMAKPRIAIIIGSTRDTRFGDKPAKWIYEKASQRGDIDVELVDLRDWPLPFFNEVATNAWVPTKNEVGQRWQKKLAEFDGFIFVTPEYNRSVPASLKNALDFAYPEWNRKAAAYVGYGGVGGARAVEHLRNISVELQMAPVRSGVHIAGADFVAVSKGQKTLDDLAYLEQNAKDLLDNLVWWTNALKAAREKA
jgi:NAD(P)H-dependent FMN reductase